ncbi:hypothetical protein C7S16_4881 [Burkholderia thailandensis]|uniref:Uncharacterized protein n=1 Tax=Burkholderia thailandensis TaxID=57975 RepID=A0AAW9CMY2_BURTH|nr:hypothetical protein [Burkholderia thailandensis]MDW9252005.1 hypothetical protein [Burkholderia thailandensis]
MAEIDRLFIICARVGAFGLSERFGCRNYSDSFSIRSWSLG